MARKKRNKKYMYTHGGYKSKYNIGGLLKKRQAGGMYADNTVASVGQGNLGNTSNIVYQESNPALQEQRVKGFEQEQQNLMRAGEEAASNIESRIERGEQEANLQAEQEQMKVDALAAQGKGILKTGAEVAGAAGLAKPGQGSTLVGALAGARNVYRGVKAANLAAKAQTGIMAGVQTAKQAQAGAKALSLASKAPGFVPGISAAPTTASLAAGAGGSAAGSALGSFATSGAGLGLIGAGLGYGVEKLWGDDDPTTTNWAEGTGGALKGAGTGATIGSMIMPGVGTAVGAGVGALVGLGQKFFGSRKAKKAKKKAEREYKAKVKKMKGKYNKDFASRFGAQQSAIRAGEMRQKTYSGYDLGQNVMAQMGGMRMGIPRYSTAA